MPRSQLRFKISTQTPTWSRLTTTCICVVCKTQTINEKNKKKLSLSCIPPKSALDLMNLSPPPLFIHAHTSDRSWTNEQCSVPHKSQAFRTRGVGFAREGLSFILRLAFLCSFLAVVGVHYAWMALLLFCSGFSKQKRTPSFSLWSVTTYVPCRLICLLKPNPMSIALATP